MPTIHVLTVRARLIAMALATTFAALLLCAGAMLAYELTTFRQAWIDDMQTQAEIVAQATAPALNFNDATVARQNLALLKVRPQILAGAIYGADGRLFASYARSEQDKVVFLDRPGEPGHLIDGDRLMLYHVIADQGEKLGTVYLEARYPGRERLLSYLSILGAVMVCSLLLAAVVASRLQRDITQPLEAVTAVAREVMRRRDFSLRVAQHSSGEIGTLVDAFNAMLSEVDRRAADLQEANQILEREMTVRQHAEQALLLADRRKDEFLATLAHELRNPLAPIRTCLDIMRLNPGDLNGMARSRTIMERQLRQMIRLVDDLLDVSRINTGKLAIRREQTQLQAVVEDALQAVRQLVELHNHQLTVTMPERPIMLEGDPTRLTQILSNLLNNAAKYTPRGGTIRLAVALEPSQVVIRVSDSGIGIAPEMIDAIFQMFVQVDASLERSTAGLGVGLSLARRLAELHDGSLEARSTGLGGGSEFILKLPFSRQLRQALEAAASPMGGAGHRILLADDNIDFVDSMGQLLVSMGHTVVVGHDGIEALAAVADFVPEYAFLDIGMPGMNGYDLARALRAMPALQHTTLIAITGWGQQKDRETAAEAGFDVHLVKPVTIEQIVAQLEPKQKT
jgi:signal transduction histidine kinase/ActR/RegA family two-component response regulator